MVVDGEPATKSAGSPAARRSSFEAARAGPLEPEDVGLRIAYEDEHLLVVDKPAGVVVHPSAGHQTGTLVHGVLAHGAAGGATRSDRGSSTGSTATPRACSSSPARRRRTSG